MSRTPPATDVAGTLARSRHRTPPALVAIGILLVAFQGWGYAAWLLADIPLERPDPRVPDAVRGTIVHSELLLLGLGALWFLWLVVATWRRRSATWPLVLSLSWTLVYWQESLVNMADHRFTYNGWFLSRGDWISYLPFVSTDGAMLPQPLLMEPLVFAALIPAAGVAVAWLLGRLSARVSSAAVLTGVALFLGCAFETAFEWSGISQQLLAWNRVPEHLALHSGTARQWPVTELPLGCVWALPGILWHFRNRVPSLNWLQPHPEDEGVRPTMLRVLALTAAINLMFLAYNLVLAVVPSPTSAVFPGWLS